MISSALVGARFSLLSSVKMAPIEPPEHPEIERAVRKRISGLTRPQFTNLKQEFIIPYRDRGTLPDVEEISEDLGCARQKIIPDPLIPEVILRIIEKSSLTASEVKTLKEFCNLRDELVVLRHLQWSLQSMGPSEFEKLEKKWGIDYLDTLLEELESGKEEALQENLQSTASTQKIASIMEQLGEYLEAIDTLRNLPFPFVDQMFRDLHTLEEYRQKVEELRAWCEANRAMLRYVPGLDLPGYGLAFLPEFLFELVGLESLELKQNQLKSLPEKLGTLTGLQTLYLQNNFLETLPNGFNRLKDLEILDLSGNSFRHFPLQITALTELEQLDIRGNELKTVPPEIVQLQNLVYLNIQDNPITQLPNECRILMSLYELQVLEVWGGKLNCYTRHCFISSAISPIRLLDEFEDLPIVTIPGKKPEKLTPHISLLFKYVCDAQKVFWKMDGPSL